MDSTSAEVTLVAHETPEVSEPNVRGPGLGPTLRTLLRKLRGHRPKRKPLTKAATLWLWSVAVLDMVGIAWLIPYSDSFDQASMLSQAITLGGHPRLILIMAVAGFGILAGLAPLTRAFCRATDLECTLLILACVISLVALAGAASAILLLVLVCVLAGILLVPLIALLLLIVPRRR
jgi:hypothetical protein